MLFVTSQLAASFADTPSKNTCFVLVGAFFVSIWFLFPKKRRRDGRVLPPSCPYGPYTCISKLLSSKGPEFLLNLTRTVGHVVSLPVVPYPKLFVISDSNLARKILSDPANLKFSKGYAWADYGAGGKSFLSSDGHRSRHVLKATSKFFSPRKIEEIRLKVLEEVDAWIKNSLRSDARKLSVLDIMHEMNHLLLKLLGRFAFGYNLSEKEIEMIIKEMDVAKLEYGRNCLRNPLRLIPGLRMFFPGVRRAQQATNNLREICKKVIAFHRSLPNPPQMTLLGMILDDTHYASDQERIADMLIYVSGGYESLAMILSWIFIELARNPCDQNWLVSELSKCSTFEEKQNCDAVKFVIRESLRLHTPGSLTSIFALGQELCIPDKNYYLPKGSVCSFAWNAMGRDASLFEQPDAFKPRRWDTASKEAEEAVLPFSTGRRRCQGQGLALCELSAIVAKVCSSCSITLKEAGHEDYLIFNAPRGFKLSFETYRPIDIGNHISSNGYPAENRSVVSKREQVSCTADVSLLANDPLVEWFLDKEPVFWPEYPPGFSNKKSEIHPFLLASDYLRSITPKILENFLPLGEPQLNEAASRILRAGGGGKKVRSLMIFFVSKALAELDPPLDQCRDVVQKQDELAQIVEVIHAATLLHDDVLDEADARRGETAAHKVTGSKVAVLSGDCLLAKAVHAMACLSHHGVVQTLSTSIQHLTMGEVMQVAGTTDLDRYLRKTFYKSGSLMAGACMSAALLGGYSSETVEACYRYGKHVGIAFQLADDILDFHGDAKSLGKPVLNDINSGHATAPVIFAAEQYPELEKMIERRFSVVGDVNRAADLVFQSDGIERTNRLAIVHAECAMQAAMELGVSVYSEGLIRLAQMAVTRSK